MKRIEEVIIASENIKAIVEFARFVPEADVSRLEDAVINKFKVAIVNHYSAWEHECFSAIFDFAWFVKKANITKLEDAIIESENISYIMCFAKKVKGADVRKLRRAITKIKFRNFLKR